MNNSISNDQNVYQTLSDYEHSNIIESVECPYIKCQASISQECKVVNSNVNVHKWRKIHYERRLAECKPTMNQQSAVVNEPIYNQPFSLEVDLDSEIVTEVKAVYYFKPNDFIITVVNAVECPECKQSNGNLCLRETPYFYNDGNSPYHYRDRIHLSRKEKFDQLNATSENFTFEEYQRLASKTAIYPNPMQIGGLNYTILSLAGEAGELANKFKKILRDDGVTYGDVSDEVISKEKRLALLKELGGILWYVAMVAKELESPLGTVALHNLNQLASRKDRNKLKGSGDDR